MRRWIGSVARQWPTVAWLTVIWVLLWGDLTVGNVVAGAVIAVVVISVLPLPAIELRGTLRPGPLLVLGTRFIADLVVASAQVSWLALRPGRTVREAVIGVQLRTRSDVFLTMTSELSSLVPGSVVIEAHRLTGMIYLHVLDLDQMGGVERVRADTLALEARVLRAFAPSDELARVGLGPSGRGGSGGRGGGRRAGSRSPSLAGARSVVDALRSARRPPPLGAPDLSTSRRPPSSDGAGEAEGGRP